MGVICRLFGHTATGYAGSEPYGKIERGGVDNMGCQHCFITVRCDRCEAVYTIARVPMPATFDPRQVWEAWKGRQDGAGKLARKQAA